MLETVPPPLKVLVLSRGKLRGEPVAISTSDADAGQALPSASADLSGSRWQLGALVRSDRLRSPKTAGAEPLRPCKVA